VQELRESIGIVQQAPDGMPSGPIKATLEGRPADREKMKTRWKR